MFSCFTTTHASSMGFGNTEASDEMARTYLEARQAMEQQLAQMQNPLPKKDIRQMAEQWSLESRLATYDPVIVALEAKFLDKRHRLTHVPELGRLERKRPSGVHRWMMCQINSASTEETKEVKTEQIRELVEEYDVQGVGLIEVGFNWSTVNSSRNLASWFNDWRPCISATNHNKHEPGTRHQQGGIGLLAFGALQKYVRKKCGDFRDLGRWQSWLLYANENHQTRVIFAYNVGRPKPRHFGSMYQQTLRYIQSNNLDTNPRRLFATDFLAVLLTWRARGERLIIFWDANEHILTGPLCSLILDKLDMVEASSQSWEGTEPNTYI